MKGGLLDRWNGGGGVSNPPWRSTSYIIFFFRDYLILGWMYLPIKQRLNYAESPPPLLKNICVPFLKIAAVAK